MPGIAHPVPGVPRGSTGSCHPSAPPQQHHTHGKGGGAMGRPPKGQALSELCAPLSSLPRARGDTFTRQIKPHQLRSAQARCCREHLGGVRLARHGGTAFRDRGMRVVMGAAGSVFPNLLQVKLVFLLKRSSRRWKSAELSSWCTQRFHNPRYALPNPGFHQGSSTESHRPCAGAGGGG